MNIQQNTQPAETRHGTRERIFLPARASYGNGAISTSCTVLQLSETGARLNLPAAFSLPETFAIAIPQRNIDCRARLVWREGDKVGIEFLPDAPQTEPTAEECAARIRALESLNAKFKAQIIELTAQMRRLTDEA